LIIHENGIHFLPHDTRKNNTVNYFVGATLSQCYFSPVSNLYQRQPYFDNNIRQIK